MFVESVRSQRVLADGTVRIYETHLLRRSFRVGGKVKHETLANLSALPPEAIAAVRAVLAGEPIVDGHRVRTLRSLPHGHVAAVWAQARMLGLPELLGPAGRQRDIAMALIVARVARPDSDVATRRWWADTTLAHDLGVADASPDELRAALDWLSRRQEHIEARLARRHLREGSDAYLSCGRLTGTRCPPPPIEYGLVTDVSGRPLVARPFSGDTTGPAAFAEQVAMVKSRFGLPLLVVVGAHHTVTPARIEALQSIAGTGWITCVRHPVVAGLANPDEPAQDSASGIHDLAEIRHPGYPGERLIGWRNPAALNGTAVIRAGRTPDGLGLADVVGTYKALSDMRRDFFCRKTAEPDAFPLRRQTEHRTRLVFCLIAAYLDWHLRQAWAPLILTVPSFTTLLHHLGTLTRNSIHIGHVSLEQLTEPTPTQQHAFELINAQIPHRLK